MPWPMSPRPTTPTVVISFTFASRLALLAFSVSRMKRSSSVEPALQNSLRARRVDGVMWTPRRTLAVERLLDASEAARRKARAALQGPCEEHAFVLSTCEHDAAARFASTCALERCVHDLQKRSAAFISRYFAKKKKLDLAELTY